MNARRPRLEQLPQSAHAIRCRLPQQERAAAGPAKIKMCQDVGTLLNA
jgi:hypothetical protein